MTMMNTPGMQAFDATEECQKVRERFALKRQLREQQRLGMPLPRDVRWVLHSSGRATARPNTCPASTAGTYLAVGMLGQPVHTDAWIRKEIGAFIPVSEMGHTAHKHLQPSDKQIDDRQPEGIQNAGMHRDHPVPQFFRPAAVDAESGATGVPDALSWRTTSPPLSGIPQPPSVDTAADMAALNPRLSGKSRDRCKGGEGFKGTTPHAEAPCQPMLFCGKQVQEPATTYINDYEDEGMYGTSVPNVVPSVVCAKDATVHKLGADVNAPSLIDDQGLGHLDEESQRLATMSQGLLKRAAELLGQSEEFEHAVEHAVEQTAALKLESTFQSPIQIAAVPFQNGTHTVDDELTPDEKGLLQDLIAAV